jgi:hypothetical protein
MSPGEPSEIRLALTLAPPMYLIKRARRPSCVHPRALECFASCSARCVAPPSRMLSMNVTLARRNLFGTGEAQALSLRQDLHEMAGLCERAVGAGISQAKPRPRTSTKRATR